MSEAESEESYIMDFSESASGSGAPLSKKSLQRSRTGTSENEIPSTSSHFEDNCVEAEGKLDHMRQNLTEKSNTGSKKPAKQRKRKLNSDFTSFYDVKVNVDVETGKYDNQLKKLMKEKCLDLQNIMPFFSLPQTEEVLEQLLDLFGLKFQFEIIQENPAVVAVCVNSDTPLSVMDSGRNLQEASQNALHKMFETVKILLH